MAQAGRPAIADDPHVALRLDGVWAGHGGQQVLRDISFSVAAGEFVTLLGPSGGGKSTLLRCIAGLHRISAGRICLAGRVVAGTGRHLRPEMRGVNMVFQSYAVWPHMSVFDNVAFGLRKCCGGAELTERVMRMLRLVRLDALAGRDATGLSGGQQQRVALARALATDPAILLLDEPLSNLDTVLRAEMREEILRIQRDTGKASLYVTHDSKEALAMSDRIIAMRDGAIVQSGTPAELYDRPANRFVAEILGPANFLRARVVGVQDAMLAVDLTGFDSPCRILLPLRGRPAPPPGARIQVLVRPEHVAPCETGGLELRLRELRFEGARLALSAGNGAETLRFDLPRGAEALSPGDVMRVRLCAASLGWVPAP